MRSESPENSGKREVQLNLFGAPSLGEARLPKASITPEEPRPNPRPVTPKQSSLFDRVVAEPRTQPDDGGKEAETTASSLPAVATSAHLEPVERPITPVEPLTTGQVGRAKDILDAVRVLTRIEGEGRLADAEETRTLSHFGGFGAVALSLFPDPVTGRYKSSSWQKLGEELQALLTADEYASARRTVFNAFYTSPAVISAMFSALSRLGVPPGATVLEPGCGSGNFLAFAGKGMHFTGIELDSLSGRIAKARFPSHDIRIESFRDTRLPEASFDAVVGNPPFADVKLDYRGERFSLHDFFFAKSLDALKPGGILALVTTHYTLDKQNGTVREHLAGKADFLGAIRLPSDAFSREGTKVVTDIVFLKRRRSDEAVSHIDPSWLEVSTLAIEGVDVPINRYFHEHPEMVLGTFSRKDRLYGGEQGFSVDASGVLEDQLRAAVCRLPELGSRVAAPAMRRQTLSVSARMGTTISGQWEPAHQLRRETLLKK
jgi:SAM-dependent methyltransferase